MKYRSLLILLLLLLSLVPAYILNRSLMHIIRPRASLLRLFAYMLAAFGFVFMYTFAIVWVISHLFPPAMK